MAVNVRRDDITAGFNYGVNLLNQAARSVTSKSDEFIEQVLGMKIDERVDFNDMNYEFMKRFMAVNINERDITMSILGQDAHLNGDSTAITGQAQRPSYADGMNYIDEFVTTAGMNEHSGVNSTRTQIDSNKFYRDPYSEPVNLYPDELDTGHGYTFNKWRLDDNDNSILYKTKKLFAKKKINTIISKFGTSVDDGENISGGLGDARTHDAGMSHGRNLLKAAAEKKGINGKYEINGYNNPYCRVWTHHYQYDRLDKLIRPFVTTTSNSFTEVAKLKDIHTWKGFEGSTYVESVNEKGEKVFKEIKGWKAGDSGWDKSVLDDNGFVKITPKYGGGGKNNVHTKDCMFSIENLAWRGYDPYSFEQALSWEQRGPLGGRIMWFPPYGLSFNETTQTNWSSNTFIGRGEDVYTYVNTVRSGTLSFIMLTDHPSVIDYANWYDGNGGKNDLTDTDILRFFAGCDSGDSSDGYSIFSKVKPTPLTDEYVKHDFSGVNEYIQKLTPNPEPQPEEIPDTKAEIQFNVFYPNNYSGVYDMPTNQQSPVHAIAYLLKGNGSQKEDDGMNDMPLSFDNLDADNSDGRTGSGYEMSGSGITNVSRQDADGNYILGSKIRWVNYKSKDYVTDTNKKWYYRTDGKYEVPTLNSDRIKNTYDQVLYDSNRKITYSGNTNYQDTQGFSLNKSADAVKQAGFSSEDNENLYSLLEVAAAVASYAGKTDTYNILISEVSDEERVKKILDIFNTYKIQSISIDGYSNSHGYNPSKKVNKDRNRSLSIERANTVKNWLKECGIVSDDTTVTSDEDKSNKIGVQVNKGDEYNNSAKSAKLYRSTKVTIHFKLDETERLSDSNGENEDDVTVYQKYNGFTYIGQNQNGKDEYKDSEGNVWYEDSEGFLKRQKERVPAKISERNTLDVSDMTNKYGRRLLFYSQSNDGEDSMNNVRYAQEYYFYKKLEKDNPIVFDKLTEKLKYFDPAFHSMTPEGFNERLTFLNQCTRQGNTISASDRANAKTASNLAFGRPPFCVLRIGDFYYQTIVIDSINIDYNVSGGLQWDLNPEGAGVQPMLAQINISFKFIGGGDLGGPIRRLQNAMTFNYYANSRLYDNRADRISYKWSDRTNGALDHTIESDKSYAYTTKMAD